MGIDLVHELVSERAARVLGELSRVVARVEDGGCQPASQALLLWSHRGRLGGLGDSIPRKITRSVIFVTFGCRRR